MNAEYVLLCIDLARASHNFSCEEVLVPAGERKLVKTGLSIAIPTGTYARIGMLVQFVYHSR